MPVEGVDPGEEGIHGAHSIRGEYPAKAVLLSALGSLPLPGLLLHRVHGLRLHRVKEERGVHGELGTYFIGAVEGVVDGLGVEDLQLAGLVVLDDLQRDGRVSPQPHHTGVVVLDTVVPAEGEVFVEEGRHALHHEHVRVDVDASVVVQGEEAEEIAHSSDGEGLWRVEGTVQRGGAELEVVHFEFDRSQKLSQRPHLHYRVRTEVLETRHLSLSDFFGAMQCPYDEADIELGAKYGTIGS